MDVRILCKCVNHCLLYNNINCLCGRFQLSRTFFVPVIRVLSDTFLCCNWYLTIYGLKFDSFLVRTSRFQAAKKHISITSPCTLESQSLQSVWSVPSIFKQKDRMPLGRERFPHVSPVMRDPRTRVLSALTLFLRASAFHFPVSLWLFTFQYCHVHW